MSKFSKYKLKEAKYNVIATIKRKKREFFEEKLNTNIGRPKEL